MVAIRMGRESREKTRMSDPRTDQRLWLEELGDSAERLDDLRRRAELDTMRWRAQATARAISALLRELEIEYTALQVEIALAHTGGEVAALMRRREVVLGALDAINQPDAGQAETSSPRRTQ
jgi:hypothetical protein